MTVAQHTIEPAGNDRHQRFVRRALALSSSGQAGFLLATTIVNLAAFFYHLLLSRQLGPSRYGALAALIGVTSLVSVPLAALEASVMRSTTATLEVSAEVSITRLLRKSGSIGLQATLAWTSIAIPLGRFLHEPAGHLLLIGPSIGAAIIVSCVQGTLMARRRFGRVALSQIAGPAAVRLGASVVFVALGLGVAGALLGTLLGGLVCLAVVVVPLRSLRGSGPQAAVDATEVARAIIALGGTAALISIDPWLARHYLPAVPAGWFNAASTAGRVALFLPSAITLVVFPGMSRQGGRGPEARRAFIQAYGLTAVLAFGAAAVLTLFPHLSIRLLFGPGFSPPRTTVAAVAFADASAALVSLLVYFLLARRSSAGRLIWAGCAATLLLGVAFHGSETALGIDMLVPDVALAGVLSAIAVAAIARDRSADGLHDPSTPTAAPQPGPGVLTVVGQYVGARVERACAPLVHYGHRASPLILRASRSRRLTLWVPTVGFAVVPLIWWTGLGGSRAAVGGDDSLLYYLQPWSWATHAPVSVLDGGFSGFNPRVYLLPLPALLSAVHLLPLDTQGVAFGVMLAGSYSGVARLVERFTSPFGDSLVPAALAGTIATAAPLVFQTEAHLLESIYWRALLPWLVLAVARWLEEGKALQLLAISALAAASAGTLMQVPWSIPAIPLGVALLVLLQRAGSVHVAWRSVTRRVVGGAAVVCALNAFWLVPLLGLFAYPNFQAASANSTGGVKAADTVVRAIARVQSVPAALGLRLSPRQSAAFGDPAPAAYGWTQHLALLGLIPVAICVVGIVVAIRRRQQRAVLLSLAAVTVVALFGETLFASEWGTSLFLAFVDNVPGLTAVRNFYDRFSIPMAIALATTTGVAAAVVLAGARRRALGVVVLTAAMATNLVYASPHLGGAEYREHLPGQLDRARVLDGLPADYQQLLRTLRVLPPGPVLTLPLATPAWSTVPAATGDGTYLGLSPIFFLTGRTDYDGLDSFVSTTLPHLRDRAATAFTDDDIAQIRGVVHLVGVRYVVRPVTLTPPLDPASYGVGVLPTPAAEQVQLDRVTDQIAPQVVAVVGRWQIDQVVSAVYAPPISAASGACSAANVDSTATTTVSAVLAPCAVASTFELRAPYSAGWSASSGATVRSGDGLVATSVGPHRRPIELTFTFGPQRLVKVGWVVSVLSVGLFAVAAAVRRRRSGRATSDRGTPEAS